MSEHIAVNRDSKFTRGEKCIFVHLIVTFALIMVLVIIYFVHLIVIDHWGSEVFKISRRRFYPIDKSPFEGYKGIGVVFLNMTQGRSLCNSMLVRERWSLAPGHCVAARSDPDLSSLIPFWVIKYRNNKYEYVESVIKRSIIHPHFNIDDFDNNIGLFEHDQLPAVLQYTLFTTSLDLAAFSNGIKLEVVSWDLSVQDMHNVLVKTNIVTSVPTEKCREYASPIVDLRSHEFCVQIGKRSNVKIAQGALVATNSNVIGFFSWGETHSSEYPIVILNITFFNGWIKAMVI